MDLGLAGRVAVVTGGTRGIGRAVAERLSAEGCAVALCARDADAARDTAAGLPGRGYGAGADVTDEAALTAFVDAAAAALGGIDLLVASAGGSSGGALDESTAADWEAAHRLNVGHPVSALRACLPHMRERGGGSAVFVSSISGRKPQPRAQYGAAKAAASYAAAALARELGPDGIRVNAVSPGSILFGGGGWDRMRERDPEGFARFERAEFPAGRLGRPEEVADVVAFLLSPRASWVSGTDVAVDGAQNAPSAFGY